MKVYGEWFDDLMRARAKRDRIDAKGLRRALIVHGHYKVRGYYYVVPNCLLTHDPQLGLTHKDGAATYRMRRDGRVERGWLYYELKDVEDQGPLENE